MKKYILFNLGLVILLALPGCFHVSDDQVIKNAHEVNETLTARYYELGNAPDDESVVDFGIRMGTGNKLSSWSLAGWWNNAIGNDYLTTIEGAPLSRTVYFLENDLREVNRQLGHLESRMFMSIPVYTKLQDLRANLQEALHIMKTSSIFSQEARYIESRRLQLQQLNETRRQNAILKDMSKPTVIYEEKIITKRMPEKKKEPVVIKEVIIEEKSADAKKKKKKKEEDEDEVVINVKDLKGKRPHLVI